MAHTSQAPGRDAKGRFARRRTTTTATTQRVGVGELALLTPAIVLGLIGFVVSICWVGSLVLLGILWGSLAVRRRQRNGGRGVLSEVVDVVAGEAKDVAEAASRSLHPDE